MLNFLGNLLESLIALIGNCICALFRAIGTAIGSLLSGILVGFGAGVLELIRILALPALIIWLIAFIFRMIRNAFFR